MSNNTLGGASRTPLECPYFDNTVCTPSRAQSYDLEYWRSDYLRLVNKLGYTALSPTALRYTDTALIIEYDSRIISDPPPTLSR